MGRGLFAGTHPMVAGGNVHGGIGGDCGGVRGVDGRGARGGGFALLGLLLTVVVLHVLRPVTTRLGGVRPCDALWEDYKENKKVEEVINFLGKSIWFRHTMEMFMYSSSVIPIPYINVLAFLVCVCVCMYNEIRNTIYLH